MTGHSTRKKRLFSASSFSPRAWAKQVLGLPRGLLLPSPEQRCMDLARFPLGLWSLSLMLEVTRRYQIAIDFQRNSAELPQMRLPRLVQQALNACDEQPF